MKYTGDNYTPHFEGLWAPVSEPDDRRRALLFLGDCYLVFFEYFPAEKRLTFSSQTYVLEDNVIYMMSRAPDVNPDEEEMQEIYWDITEDHLLEIEQDGEKSVWEPVLVETLAEEGFPISAIQAYRESHARHGIPYSVVGVAPTPATMQAIKKLKGKKK